MDGEPRGSGNVIIIGAPRSGTNMLRDVLAGLDGIATWPCDEINYIWRHGNVRFPSDELQAERATPEIAGYIQGRFEAIRRSQGGRLVVEKTCANSLRVPFVDRAVPSARYVYIHRDGLDAAGSAMMRWKAGLDIPYVFRKLRYVPPRDIPYYALRYLWNRVYRLFSRDKRLAFWGPRLDGMDEVLQTHTLAEVCVLQWQRCVEKAEAAFAGIGEDRVIRVRYEKFVCDPVPELLRVLAFLGHDASEAEANAAVSGVSANSVGKGRASLGQEEIANLESLVDSTLDRYGYRGGANIG